MQNGRAKTRVFHAVERTYKSVYRPDVLCPDEYVLVAEVETSDPNEAFALTNTGDQVWWLNIGVHACVVPCRSTSVGDIIVLPDGEALAVEPIGFARLDRV